IDCAVHLIASRSGKLFDVDCASLYFHGISISAVISRKGGKLFRTVLIRIDTICRTSDRVKPVSVGNAGITGSLFQCGISNGKFRPELSNVLPLTRVDVTATFIASLVLAGKGFRPSVNLVLYSFWNFI